jgi:EAL and modified HD-GYP domain-containing signal transduction protein
MDQQASFEVLKTYPGLLYRQPIFSPNEPPETVGYFVAFLDWHGSTYSDKEDIPDFVNKLPELLFRLCQQENIFLTIPTSWIEHFPDECHPNINITLITDDVDLNVLKPYMKLCFNGEPDDVTTDKTSTSLLVDLTNHSPTSLIEQSTTWLEQFEQLLVCNVDYQEQFKFCSDKLNCLIKGNFYTQPLNLKSNKVTTNYQTLLQLLVELQDPDISPDQLAETINQDVGLSYKLLRLINSAFFGMPREISSCKQAIVMLGNTKIKTWASMLALTGVEDKPNELKITAMLRAKMCELLAKYYKADADTFFAAGLFSSLDALMDKPLEDIIERLPLSDELTSALLKKQGAAGQALSDVMNYEQGLWQAANQSRIPIQILSRVYLDALNWTDEVNAQLSS